MRASIAGAIRRTLYNELRVQWRAEEVASTPLGQAPAVLVLNAFDAGGAQLAGSRGLTLVEAADDLDISAGRHAIRTGFQLDAGSARRGETRNAGGGVHVPPPRRVY